MKTKNARACPSIYRKHASQPYSAFLGRKWHGTSRDGSHEVSTGSACPLKATESENEVDPDLIFLYFGHYNYLVIGTFQMKEHLEKKKKQYHK